MSMIQTNENTWPGWAPDCYVHTQATCTCGNSVTINIGPVATANSSSFLGDGDWTPPMRSRLGGWIGFFCGAYVPPVPAELRAERPATAGRPAVVAPVFRREPRRNPRCASRASRRARMEAAP